MTQLSNAKGSTPPTPSTKQLKQKHSSGIKRSIFQATPMLTFVGLVALVCAGLDGFLSIVMMNAIDTIKTKNIDIFQQEVLKLMLVAIAMIPATILLAYARGLFKRKAIVSVKVNFLQRVFKKHINEFQKDNTAKYVSALTNDINTIENNYIDGVYNILVSSINFIVAILVIGYASPIALVYGIAISVVSTLISIFVSKPVQKHQIQRSSLYEGYTTYIKEVLGAFHIIKANNLGEKVSNDFYRKSEAIQHKGYVIDKINTYIFALQHLTMNGSFVALVGTVAALAIQGKLSLGAAVLVVTNMEKVMQPLMDASDWLPKLFSTKQLFTKIDSTLKNNDNYEETIEIDGLKTSIRFDKVTFSYDNEHLPVLNEVNLSLERGGKYLVVGPSGGGKSTLLKLLRKYDSPKGGAIYIDGQNLIDVTKDSYFRHISNIEQQVFLFEDTVRNNICLYKDYSDEVIYEAIHKAGLDDYIESLEHGLDSILVDNGKNVSGGEKSRLAIARCLLQKTDLILLDEAFASLDSKIAQEIERTILSLDDITVVNVSHVVFESTKHLYTNVFQVKNRTVTEPRHRTAAIAYSSTEIAATLRDH